MEANISESLKQITKESHQMLELVEEVNKLQKTIKNQQDLLERFRKIWQIMEEKLRSAGDENINDELRAILKYEVNIEIFNPNLYNNGEVKYG